MRKYSPGSEQLDGEGTKQKESGQGNASYNTLLIRSSSSSRWTHFGLSYILADDGPEYHDILYGDPGKKGAGSVQERGIAPRLYDNNLLILFPSTSFCIFWKGDRGERSIRLANRG